MDIGALVHAFFDYAGPGGIFVLLVYGVAITIYYLLIRWIIAGRNEDEPSTPNEQTVSTET